MAAAEAPLDLGAGSKRKHYDAAPPPGHAYPSYKKMAKLEHNSSTTVIPNGILFKVDEPSVLMTSEPSTITTVMNTAVSAKDQPEGAGLPESDDVKPKDEQPEYLGTKPKSEDYPSSSGGATKDRNPESAVDRFPAQACFLSYRSP